MVDGERYEIQIHYSRHNHRIPVHGCDGLDRHATDDDHSFVRRRDLGAMIERFAGQPLVLLGQVIHSKVNAGIIAPGNR